MTSYNKPKRYFEKSGVVDPKDSYYVHLENMTNMDNQDKNEQQKTVVIPIKLWHKTLPQKNASVGPEKSARRLSKTERFFPRSKDVRILTAGIH